MKTLPRDPKKKIVNKEKLESSRLKSKKSTMKEFNRLLPQLVPKRGGSVLKEYLQIVKVKTMVGFRLEVSTLP